MENSFEISYGGQPVPVDYQQGEKENEYLFTARLPDGAIKLQCKKDNEGAFQWLEENNNATAKAKEIGESIETYLMEKRITL